MGNGSPAIDVGGEEGRIKEAGRSTFHFISVQTSVSLNESMLCNVRLEEERNRQKNLPFNE